MFSILIPSYNNFAYLKLCIESIKKNSLYNHQIIIHVNEGSDGTLNYVKNESYDYTYSKKNIGMPSALNTASKLAKFDYIVISHDDFYYCPNWDTEFKNEIDKLNNKSFYLSGIMIGHSKENIPNIYPPIINAGNTVETFDEKKLLNNLEQIKTFDFQGTTKQPGLVHKDIWNKVGGWSEEFFPTGGDDTDFIMKLWNENIRIFKGLGKCSVYHFGSITTRKKDKRLFTYLGSKANKIFLKKWKISINLFEKFYLRSGINKDKSLIFQKYDGPLKEPKKNIEYFYELIKSKLKIIYLLIVKN